MFPSYMFNGAGNAGGGKTVYGTKVRNTEDVQPQQSQQKSMASNANMWMALAAAAKEKNQQLKQAEHQKDLEVAGIQGDFASELGYPSYERDAAMRKERDYRDPWEFAMPHNWIGSLLGAANDDAGDKWKSIHK